MPFCVCAVRRCWRSEVPCLVEVPATGLAHSRIRCLAGLIAAAYSS